MVVVVCVVAFEQNEDRKKEDKRTKEEGKDGRVETRKTKVHVKYRLVGPVVKTSTSRAEDPTFESRLRRVFSGVESYQ